MPKFKLNTQWMMTAVVEVEASTRAEAIEQVINQSEMPDGTYLDDSFTVSDYEE